MSSRSARPPRTANLLDTRCVEGAEAEQRAEARGREATDTNQLLITSASASWLKRQAAKEKAKEAAARAAAAASAPQSKAQRRKLEQLEARKRKAEARSHVLATLAQHRTSAEEARLLQSSSSMWQKPTTQSTPPGIASSMNSLRYFDMVVYVWPETRSVPPGPSS